MTLTHTFHIPVMGIGYTIDTPIKVAHLGISSVLSLGDDMLLERLREHYAQKFNFDFTPISKSDIDKRAKRITEYLNLVNKIVNVKFQELRNSVFEKATELRKYMEMLPDVSSLKQEYNRMLQEQEPLTRKRLQDSIKKSIQPGSIDVNVMTKLDRINYNSKGEAYPVEYNDAHAAVRGFANSELQSSLVLSAGLSPRLFSYIATFESFFPDKNGNLTKKIILKVSDYRSALVQGKMLAKKGIWVSEYRIESGLNCGGHAFASEGYTLGLILEEFKQNRQDLIDTTHQLLNEALKSIGRPVLNTPLEMKISAQGGVGNFNEHRFLSEYYRIDSVGWGTPFLLVPEVVNIDKENLSLLTNAKEEDLYLSGISPLGVPFNSVRGNSKDKQRDERIKKGKPGSPCKSQFLKLYNTEFTEKPICEASSQYQKSKIQELNAMHITDVREYQKRYNKITEKTCICTGLVRTAYSENKILKSSDEDGVSICPGPNIAYFSKISSLEEMVGHIYGRINILNDTYRPNMFMKEFGMYVDYIEKEIAECSINEMTDKQIKHFNTFRDNLLAGIDYYKTTLPLFDTHTQWKSELEHYNQRLQLLNIPTHITA
ncbi:MAG: hypothetical protein M0R38_03545 [Bacteroidia bacterium]|nr:hypothetical protein [Bacteroidia bacterium]